jgi:hypothetical protein
MAIGLTPAKCLAEFFSSFGGEVVPLSIMDVALSSSGLFASVVEAAGTVLLLLLFSALFRPF